MCLSVSSNSSGESVKVPSYKVSPLGSSLLPFLFLPVAYRSAELLPEITQDIKNKIREGKKKENGLIFSVVPGIKSILIITEVS